MAKLDSVLVKISTFLHLVQADQTQVKANLGKPEFHGTPAKAKQIIGAENGTIEEVNETVNAENSIDEFDYAVEEISESVTAGKVVDKNDATLEVDASESSDSDDDPNAVAATIVDMLNCVKSSDGCYAVSREEQFRRSAMAFYKQPNCRK